MPHADQPSHPAASPGDPESVHRVYLTTDIRPAMRTATASQLRNALAGITRHLCHHLTGPPGIIPSPDAGTGQPGPGLPGPDPAPAPTSSSTTTP